MIIGTYSSKITTARRLAIPQKVREMLGENLIVSKWYEGCLVLISESMWQNLMSRIGSTDKIPTTAVRDTERFIMGSAYNLQTDSQGRAVLPAALTLYASLQKDVYFVGLGDRVEVWDKSTWEKHEANLGSNASQMLDQVANAQKSSSASITG
jgi:MraZ protein